MSRKFLLGCAILALLVMSAFTIGAQDDEAVIGVLIPSTAGEFYAGVVEGAEALATEYGVSVEVLSSDNEIETELANAEALIEQGVSAVIINPLDAVESLPAIEALNAAEIPVFLMDRGLDFADAEVEFVSTIGMDNLAAGASAAEYLCTSLEEAGNVLVLVNMPEMEEDADMAEDAEMDEEVVLSPADARLEGFNTFLAESCTGLITTELNLNGLEDAEVSAAITDALDGTDAVFATNGDDILTAMTAVIRARLSGVTLIGFDATEDTLGAIQLGRLNGVISPNGGLLGATAVETAAQFLTGEEIELTYTLDPLVINADAFDAVRSCGIPGFPPCSGT